MRIFEEADLLGILLGIFFFLTFGSFLSALTVPRKHIKEEKLSKFLIVIT